MSKNKNLNDAKEARMDEFYTQYSDIHDEVMKYKEQFKGKVVYCNCDNPYWSNFPKFFFDYFHELKLTRLIATGFNEARGEGTLFFNPEQEAYCLDYHGTGSGLMDDHIKPLEGSGDFRSEECLVLLDECDIVVSNPPFSLFSKYIECIFSRNKKCLVIGNINAVTHLDLMPIILNGELRVIRKDTTVFYFEVPDDKINNKTPYRIKTEGKKVVSLTFVRWFTNLQKVNENPFIPLVKSYSPEAYPEYDNFHAIEVSRTKDIPKDWGGGNGSTYYLFR